MTAAPPRPGPRRLAGLRRSDIGLVDLIPHHVVRVSAGLAALAATVAASVAGMHHPAPGWAACAGVGIALAVVGWLGWLWAKPGGWLLPGALVLMAVGGGVASAVTVNAVVFAAVAASGAALSFDLGTAALLAGVGPVCFVAAAAAHGDLPGRLLVVAVACLAGLLSSTGRRQIILRTRQAARVAAADQRTDLARREAQLAEDRNRMAREVHDVLAHTLGALSMKLTALESLVASGVDVARLRQEIEISHRLVGEGLDEARHAVHALREDPTPLPARLAELAALHQATFRHSGPDTAIAVEVGLALYRVAQEALTNAHKHAPGAPVTIGLIVDPNGVMLTVSNRRAVRTGDTRIGASGGGFGLQGMRERLLLVGGRLRAGPVPDDGWQVVAQVPSLPTGAPPRSLPTSSTERNI
ncbi:hypothetical protein Athai_46930 [Actinocatenispora thailandica]|uniref:histidine kinase n=1 Tax=Actinocatenispora thailandica TaxID=227318 RepID=A0A7R7DT46_9ACTN|nr:hypothetical protein Athai_46930 [Actinocatenispora thailandica]